MAIDTSVGTCSRSTSQPREYGFASAVAVAAALAAPSAVAHFDGSMGGWWFNLLSL